MVFLWISFFTFGVPFGLLSLSFLFPMFSFGFNIVFLLTFLWFSTDLLLFSFSVSMAFPLIFLRFLFEFPLAFLWSS